MDYVTVSVKSEHGRHIGDFVGAGRAKTLEKRLGFGCRHNVYAYIYCILAAIYRDGLQKVIESIHHGENFAIPCLPQAKKFNLFTTYVMTYIDSSVSLS